MKEIDQIEAAIAPLRAQLRTHPLYQSLNSLDDVKTFMEQHVYAVWDFMSLLKSLQQKLSCVESPWTPPAHSSLSRFINEIVLGEESDIDLNGRAISHYQMYLEAMEEVGASTQGIQDFLKTLSTGKKITELIEEAPLEEATREFLSFTFKTIATGKPHLIAAAFTFGREDLIPDMFIEIVGKAAKKNETTYPKFMYYLNRHIEIDGDEHGPLSLKMVAALCGTDAQKWEEAKETALQALAVRIELWNAIQQRIGTPITI